MKKNISMDVLMREEEEADRRAFDMSDFEPRITDFEEDKSTSSIKNLMKKVGEKYDKKQTTLDAFFIKSEGGITLEDAELRIQTLECENAVLKNEVQEMKERMDRLESLLFNTTPVMIGSSDPISQNLLYDKMSTRVREIEKDMVNMKMTMESIEASQEDHEDRIEWLESHYEDEDSRVGKDEELPDLGF